jgi:ankyrin repeat protein
MRKQVQLLPIALCCFFAIYASSEIRSNGIDSFDEFLMACSKGDMQIVENEVREHPEYVLGQSRNGESCLHVAGILGQADVTRFILQHGGNPNQRSTYEHGLRMTPLSWNVYGKHLSNVRLLLDAGADVNLDFDYMENGEKIIVTVLDLLYVIEIFSENDAHSDGRNDTAVDRKHYDMRDLLLRHGAKRYQDLLANSEL